MDYNQQLIEWFNKHEIHTSTFDLVIDKLHESREVSAIMFLWSKLKDKKSKFLHPEYEILCTGKFDEYEEFTEADVKLAISYGIGIVDDECFSI